MSIDVSAGRLSYFLNNYTENNKIQIVVNSENVEKVDSDLERDTLHSMEETEVQSDSTSDKHDRVQTAAAKAHHYDTSKYDRPSVTTDIVVFTLRHSELQVLLVQRKNWPFAGKWAIPGGFVRMEESLEDAARRELAEETGVDDPDIYLEQLYTFGHPERDPRTRVITVSYFALISSDLLRLRASSDAAAAEWFPAYHPPALAFDHADILAYAIRRLRYKLEYSA